MSSPLSLFSQPPSPFPLSSPSLFLVRKTQEAGESWVHGGNGFTLFDTDDGLFAIGAKASPKGRLLWSTDLRMVQVGSLIRALIDHPRRFCTRACPLTPRVHTTSPARRPNPNRQTGVLDKTPFEIRSNMVGGKRGCYLLAYKVTSMPGVFQRTSLVTIMSRYCIINYSDENIEICQENSFESPVTIRFSRLQLITSLSPSLSLSPSPPSPPSSS